MAWNILTTEEKKPYKTIRDVVLLPAINSSNGDTDIEEGDDEITAINELANVGEVSGTLEVHSSRSLTMV